MNKLKKYFITVLAFCVIMIPLISFAQATPGVSGDGSCSSSIEDVGDMLCKVGDLLKSIIPLLVGIGMVYFIWGVVTYVISSDEEAKKSGKDRIIYGIIGFVVISGLWGLVTIVINTFGIDSQNSQYVSEFVQNNNNSLNSNILTCDLGVSPKLANLLNYFTCILSGSVIPFIFSIAVVMFTWGVVQYVINGQEEAKREKGKQFMIWGIIGLTVMVGVWGLVRIVGDTFGIENAIPQLK